MSSNYETVEFFKEQRRRHQSSYKSDGGINGAGRDAT